MLTEKQKKDYLASHGAFCPYCGTNDMRGGQHNADDNWMSNAITCHNCNAEWEDIYNPSIVNDIWLNYEADGIFFVDDLPIITG